MNDNEKLEHEAIKNLLKLSILNNANLSPELKKQAMANIDKAALQADWVIGMIRTCGYI